MRILLSLRLIFSFIFIGLGLWYTYTEFLTFSHLGLNTTLSYRSYPNETGYALYNPIFYGMCIFTGSYLLVNCFKDLKK